MKVRVSKDGAKGWIEYDEEKKSFSIDFSSFCHCQKKIEDYLSKKRKFRIPESQKIDDYRVDEAYPYDSMDYFKLSLLTLFANTDVFVEWETQEGGS